MHNNTIHKHIWGVIATMFFNPTVQIKYENRWWNVPLLEVVAPRKPCSMQRIETMLPKYCSIYRNLSIFFFFEISKLFAKMPVDGRKLNRGRPLSATKGQWYGLCNICEMQGNHSL